MHSLAAFHPSSHRYVSQRLKLHYVDWGNSDAPPLLLVHGGKDHCRSWDWVAETLCDRWHVIAPDLRGHGDSDWSPDGDYSLANYLYDIAQLIHQLKLAPLTIVAHSLGGDICSRFAGLYPEQVQKLVLIEGLGMSPRFIAERDAIPRDQRLRAWIDKKRAAAGRQIKRYASFDEAYERMRNENSFLTEEQAKHLTVHGTSQNEDGTFSWKFDNHLNVFNELDIPLADKGEIWARISCPTLLLYGKQSPSSKPTVDGRIKHFQNAQFVEYEEAGHWLHHDQFDRFMTDVNGFLAR